MISTVDEFFWCVNELDEGSGGWFGVERLCAAHDEVFRVFDFVSEVHFSDKYRQESRVACQGEMS